MEPETLFYGYRGEVDNVGFYEVYHGFQGNSVLVRGREKVLITRFGRVMI